MKNKVPSKGTPTASLGQTRGDSDTDSGSPRSPRSDSDIEWVVDRAVYEYMLRYYGIRPPTS